MTVAQMAYMANSRSGATGRSDRATEYDAFARVTQRMATGTSSRVGELATALFENQRLWSTLAEDVALPTNGLPPRLREGIFYLYQFTRQHSPKVLDGTASVDVLVDINMAVMRGLRGDKGAT